MGKKLVLECDGEGCTATFTTAQLDTEASWVRRDIADRILDFGMSEPSSRYYCPRCALSLDPPLQMSLEMHVRGELALREPVGK